MQIRLFRKTITFGYILIAVLIGSIAYTSFYEWRKLETLEEENRQIDRFRYYSPKMGMYISSDPIGLAGNNPTLYGYVQDVNIWMDPWGLLNEFDIAGYGNSAHAKDGLTAHELLQNAWLRNNNIISGRTSGIASSNPAIALQENMHKRISKLQANYGLHNPDILRNQTALQNINRNTALTRRGIYEDLISRGWDPIKAKTFATKKAMVLRSEAINFAKKNGLIKGCH